MDSAGKGVEAAKQIENEEKKKLTEVEGGEKGKLWLTCLS